MIPRPTLAGWSLLLMLGAASLVEDPRAALAKQPPAPKQCGASVIPADGSDTEVHILGAVKSVTASKEDKSRFAVIVNDGKTDQSFGLYISPAHLPFKVGDQIVVKLRRGGGWHQVYDGLIKNAAGKVLLIASGSGFDDWADGWQVSTGQVVKSEHNPNAKEQSEQRTHALNFVRGKTKLNVPPETCIVMQDGDDLYLVSGFGHSWLGLRPPEGVDYQTFSMIRRELPPHAAR